MDHHGVKRVALVFAYNKALIAEVKQLPGANWSQSRQVWQIPTDPDSGTSVLHHFEGKAMVDCSALQRVVTASDQTKVPVAEGQKEGPAVETLDSELFNSDNGWSKSAIALQPSIPIFTPSGHFWFLQKVNPHTRLQMPTW